MPREIETRREIPKEARESESPEAIVKKEKELGDYILDKFKKARDATPEGKRIKEIKFGGKKYLILTLFPPEMVEFRRALGVITDSKGKEREIGELYSITARGFIYSNDRTRDFSIIFDLRELPPAPEEKEKIEKKWWRITHPEKAIERLEKLKSAFEKNEIKFIYTTEPEESMFEEIW
jgi:hypothetical protein